MYIASRCLPAAVGPGMGTSRPKTTSCAARPAAIIRHRHAAHSQHQQQPPVQVHASSGSAAPMGTASGTSALPQSAATTTADNTSTTTASSTSNHTDRSHGSSNRPAAVAAQSQVITNEVAAATGPTAAAKLAEDNPAAGLPPKAILQAVTYSATQTLSPQPNWQSAVAVLTSALTTNANNLISNLPASTSSGVLRFEVPLPRSSGFAGNASAAGFTALQWLQGQEGLRNTLHQVYFSGRNSTAPDTPGTAAAEAASEGWAAVSGLGAAWVWQGAAGQGFDSGVMSGVQRFLSEGQPRLRILGGSRFNQYQTPSAEWAAFGSYLFILPQIEVSEVDGAVIMAVNCAWDTRMPQQLSANAAAAGSGPATLPAAVQQALNTLQMLQPPARAGSPSLTPATGPSVHTPDYPAWENLLTTSIGVLRSAAAGAAGSEGSGTGLATSASVDTDLARQEFISGGQQGLDELLSAFRGGEPDPVPLATLQEETDEDHAAAAAAAAADGSSSSSIGGVASGDGGVADAVMSSNGSSRRISSSNGTSQQQHHQQHRADGSRRSSQQVQQQQQQLVKVVLARRTAIPWQSTADDFQQQPSNPSNSSSRAGWQRTSGTVLLQALQERDPRAYQLYLSTPPGAVFLACTPERLYVRSGRSVASEAVAGTRPRGPPGDLEADFYQGLDLLQSPKDHAEFTVVREWIKQQLTPLCTQLKTEVQKSVLKQSSVQHLYGRLAGVLKRGVGDAAVLAALHPTPAVCGRPREEAMKYLEDSEPFDRGFYAGPFGWVSGQGAEFVVAIRSAMIPVPPAAAAPAAPAAAVPSEATHSQGQLLAYAGVGVVPGSEVAAEWQELCLKVRQFEGLLSPLLAPPIQNLPNQVMAWAMLLVEELCRLGVSTFAVAPGSRSSPLALAAASHPRSQLTVAIDERSLGFWALGYSRGNPSGMPAAVVCSSGTAVANLLPAVVEASQSNVPLLLLTADRPFELRDTGANQTIDQVKIFGGYTRWSTDVTPPTDQVPGRVVVSTADTAIRHCVSGPRPGPAHLNFQFREPLAPRNTAWDPEQFLQGLEQWMQSAEPYTGSVVNPGVNLGYHSWQQQQQQQQSEQTPGLFQLQQQLGYSSSNGRSQLSQQQDLQRLPSPTLPVQPDAAAAAAASPELAHILHLLRHAQRALVIIGEQQDAGAAAAAVQLAAALGCPAAADVLSGLRVGSSSSSSGLIHHLDHVLLADSPDEWWGCLQPDVIVQVGPRVTSKRINQFMEWSAQRGTPWCFVHPTPERHDANHLVNHHLAMTPQQLLQIVTSNKPTWQQPLPLGPGSSSSSSSSGYADLLSQLDSVVSTQVDASLARMSQLSEMAVARQLSSQIPAGSGIFLGNSMPIRDMDMYAGLRHGGSSRSAPADVAVTNIVAGATSAAAAGAGNGSRDDLGFSNTAAAAAAASGPAAQGFANDDDNLLSPTGIGSLPLGGLLSSSGSSSLGLSSSSGNIRSQNPGLAVSPATPPKTLVGIPVAANRGASGIDGVLSTAAGFASGLKRPVTLVIGDLSFLHDVNGLSLLRNGEMSPPLTVILVNNKGGGIFGFLPVAGAVGREAFERLWGTPQNVDLEGLCRAHGIPHQRVTSPDDLSNALNNAWGINRHSVVEVITDRQQNLALHKQLQADVQSAVHKAYDQLVSDAGKQQQQRGRGQPLLLPPVLLPQPLVVSSVQVSSYNLPLTKPLTSTDKQQDGLASMTRQGLLLTVTLAAAAAGGSSSRVVRGIGEAAPLPGLHTETYDQVLCQLQMLSHLLQNVTVPYTLAPLSSLGFSRWLQEVVGLNPDVLFPSVRFALESAVLQGLAEARGCTLSDLLLPAGSSSSSGSSSCSSVRINGLLPGSGSIEQMLAATNELVQQGFRTIKVKVGRRLNPEDDAAVVLALHQHLNFNSNSKVTLTADANRAWSLDQALQFGRALAAASAGSGSSGSSSSSVLAYIEEPTTDPADMATFYAETGIPVAADESLDQGLVGPPLNPNSSSSSTTPLDLNPSNGLAAVVVKPSAVGGFERAWGIMQWAQKEGLRCVISSSFESSVGTAALLQLAAAVDVSSSSSGSVVDGQQQQQQQQRGSSSGTLANGLWTGLGGAVLPMFNGAAADGGGSAAALGGSGPQQQQQQQQWHGLGTLSWFAEDIVPGSSSIQQHAAEVPAAAAWSLLQDTAAAAAAADITAEAAAASLNGSTAAAAGTMTHPAAGLAAQQQEVRMEKVQYELVTPSGVKMQVRGVLAHPMQCESQSAASSSSSSGNALPVVLLHGFMGSAADWQPLMSALAAAGHPCLAVNLPGHGGTGPSSSSSIGNGNGSSSAFTDADLEECCSIPAAAAAVEAAAAAAFGSDTPCVLVGYSMGARVALQISLATQQQQQQQYTLLNPGHQDLRSRVKVSWAGAVVISGTPGIPDRDLRSARILKDAELADMLTQLGSDRFLSWWYDQPLWRSLRSHPRFESMLQQRCAEQRGNEQGLALSLKHSSTGKMEPLWGQLKSCQLPMLLIAGQLDEKFSGIKRRMAAKLRQGSAVAAGSSSSSDLQLGGVSDVGAQIQQRQQQQRVVHHQWAELPGVGHAVHVEAPMQLLKLVQGFMDTLQ